VERIEEGLFEAEVAAIQIQANAVVPLHGGRIFAVIAIGDQEIGQAVLVKIEHFKISVAINGRLGEYKIVGGKSAVAVVEEDIKALLLLGEEHCDIWPAIAVEILDDAANGARAWQQEVLAVLLTAQIFKPGKAPCV